VMNEGKIQQVGTPEEVYQQPINEFVKDFIGVTLKDLAELGDWIKQPLPVRRGTQIEGGLPRNTQLLGL